MTEMREKIARAASQAVERSIDRLKGLHDYASRPAWDAVVAEEIEASVLALIEPVMEENRQLQIQRLTILGMVYAVAPETVTRICGDIDPNGALLADVRKVNARAALSPKSENRDG